MSSWKPDVEILEERFQSLNKNEDILNNYILEHGSWLNADQVTEEKRNVDFPISGFVMDNRSLLDTLLFENLVENVKVTVTSEL